VWSLINSTAKITTILKDKTYDCGVLSLEFEAKIGKTYLNWATKLGIWRHFEWKNNSEK
jgi:hypothetical protein